MSPKCKTMIIPMSLFTPRLSCTYAMAAILDVYNNLLYDNLLQKNTLSFQLLAPAGVGG